jgi:hypothetical protein
MSDKYTPRRSERAITDHEEMLYVLGKAMICRVGMCDGDEPYVLPMNFGYRDGAFYLHSSLKGRKAEILRNNPKVCIQVEADCAVVEDDEPCGWTMVFRSVMAFGEAVFLESQEDKIAGLQAIMDHYTTVEYKAEDFRPKILEKTAVIRVDIHNMTGMVHGHSGMED